MFGRWLNSRIKYIVLFVFILIIYPVWFYCLDIGVKYSVYPTIFNLAVGIIALTVDYFQTKQKFNQLKDIRDFVTALREFPDPANVSEEELQRIIEDLCDEHAATKSDNESSAEEMVEYYNLWVHQIKTPIAGMRLRLDGMDSDEARILKSQLVRIEQYVEMVLIYQRLNSSSTDYVFAKTNINNVTKACIKKFMGDFFSKHLSVDYQLTDTVILTDEKWISFVIEQVISNAIKYTNEGKVTISMEDDVLIISDTGIGIREEDLPRIFEKGYTGNNGRVDLRASGLGLYLCKKICENLGHSITAKSEVGKGTSILINLKREDRQHE